MTEVKIHGYLSKIFGSSFKFHLGKMNDVVKAIDSIKSGFRKKLIELQSNGYIYSLEVNGNLINIVPVINGSGGVGRAFAKVLSVVLVVVGIVLLFVPGFQSLGIQLIMSGVQLGIAAFFPPKIKFPDTSGSTGGATFSNQAAGKSYIFSNASNLASQGSLINIGYGEFLVGSRIINLSVKNYTTNQTFAQENYFTYSEPESSTFIEENDPNLQVQNIT
jgi:predicted phage tail protein